TLTVSVNDNGNVGTGGAMSGSATVPITVSPVNDAPVAVNDTVTTAEDTAATGDVRTNDTDVETPSRSLTVTQVDGTPIAAGGSGAVAGGTVPLDAAGTLTFAPTPDFNGTFTFTYQVTDTGDGASPALTSNLATVTVNVTAVNDAPVASGPRIGSTP